MRQIWRSVITISSFWRKKRKQLKLFLADTQEGHKCAFPSSVVPGEAGTSFLPAYPSCSVAPSFGISACLKFPFHQHTQRLVSQLEPTQIILPELGGLFTCTAQSAKLRGSVSGTGWEKHDGLAGRGFLPAIYVLLRQLPFLKKPKQMQTNKQQTKTKTKKHQQQKSNQLNKRNCNSFSRWISQRVSL